MRLSYLEVNLLLSTADFRSASQFDVEPAQDEEDDDAESRF